MESEDDLLNLLLKSPNSESIQTIAEKLEIDHSFYFSKDKNNLPVSYTHLTLPTNLSV